jgi:hypothetical protein
MHYLLKNNLKLKKRKYLSKKIENKLEKIIKNDQKICLFIVFYECLFMALLLNTSDLSLHKYHYYFNYIQIINNYHIREINCSIQIIK